MMYNVSKFPKLKKYRGAEPIVWNTNESNVDKQLEVRRRE